MTIGCRRFGAATVMERTSYQNASPRALVEIHQGRWNAATVERMLSFSRQLVRIGERRA